MESDKWAYLTAPQDLWAKIEDNGVDKEVRVVAIGVHQHASTPVGQDDGTHTALLVAEPDNRWDRELQQQWHMLKQVRRLYFRPRRGLGR
jgi:hypothetical protein